MSTNEENSKMIIEVGHAKGIVYEEYTGFEKSIFKNVYARAKALTKQIIDRNEELQALNGHGNDFRNKEQVENTIAFLGGRGTGKTSAMLSFMEGLKDHYKAHDVIEDDNKKYNFISLEWIDASFLEDNEDIFVMILAKMFGELLKYHDKIGMDRDRAVEYDFRNLYQQFEKIYRRISNLKRKDEVYNEELPVDFLKDLSRSTEVRSDFRELVRAFVRFVVEVEGIKEKSNNTYVVIAVDDIDLNIKRGYDILETIHKYLMVPGVIVLVALNYEEMMLCCEKHYIENYGLDMPQKVVEDIGVRAIEMSEQYLEKVLPPYMRLYMPSLQKRDFQFRNPKIRVQGEKEDGKTDPTEMEIKEYMFDLIYKRTGVLFDAVGKKRHFMEPSTLRNLNAIYEIYNEMSLLPKFEDENYLKIYDENYYKMINDILFRFASDSLPNREYRLLMRWSEEDILRRGEEIVKDVIASIPGRSKENIGDKSNGEITDFPEDFKYYGYSYGELLRALYCLSRMGVYDKRLVHVLLAQYTVVFSRIFEHYKKEEKGNTQGKNRERINALMGDSVGGSWVNYIQSLRKKNGKDKSWFATSFSESDTVILLRIGKSSPLYKLFDSIKEKVRTNAIKNKCKEILHKPEFEALKVIMFFFDCFDTAIDDWFELYKPAKEEGESENGSDGAQSPASESKVDEYQFKFKQRAVQFNVLNFVKNSFNYENVIRRFYKSVLISLYKHYNIDENVTDDEVEAILNEDRATDQENEETLLKKFDKWHHDKGGLAIPVYNLDITYNLIKRLCVMEQDEGQCEKGLAQLVSIFEIIKIRLREQDSFYKRILGKEDKKNEEDKKNNKVKFEEIFNECPIVKCICGNKCDEFYSTIISNIAGVAIKTNKKKGAKSLSDM